MVAATLVLAGCTGHSAARQPRATKPASIVAGPQLSASQPCPSDPSFQCSTLNVPLDRSGRVPGRLSLKVEVQQPKPAPKGYLVFLSGGPGQGGASYAERLSQRFPEVDRNYRWVSLDFRGTGAGALDCPQLQHELGYDDLSIPTVAAVRQCVQRLGPAATRYSVTDTVADLDDLRQALGAQTWAMDGISYGTYIGERYVLAHPQNVSRLVLDSVVPHTGDEALQQTTFHAFARVLADLCRQRRCPSDPVADLAAVLKHRTDAATVSDAILEAGIYDGKYLGVPEALDAAARGNPALLDALIGKRAADAAQSDIARLSQGTHASSLCADMTWPWSGQPETTPAQRAARLAAAARAVGDRAFYPFTAAQGAGSGLAVTCENWPATVAPKVARTLPPVPTLLLGGSHDLSCPIEWLRQEAAVTPDSQVRIFANTGHSQQTWNGDPAAIIVLSEFLDR